MDIKHLRYFVTIADCASINRASENLHVAQSSLSVHLSNLEADVGVKLMERGREGVKLTPAGQKFYEQAHNLLRQYQVMCESVRGSGDVPRGRVSLGMPSTTSAVIAKDLYSRTATELPEITVYITDAGAGSIYEWLLDGRVDLAIMFSVPDNTELQVTPLHEEEFWLVSPAGSGSSVSSVDFDALFQMPLVTSSRSTPWRKALDEIAERFGRTISPIIETESVAAIRSILSAGHASAVLPRSYIEREISGSDLIYRPLVNPGLAGMLSLVHLSATTLEPAQRAVKDIVVSLMQEFRTTRDVTENALMPVARSAPTIMLPSRASRKCVVKRPS